MDEQANQNQENQENQQQDSQPQPESPAQPAPDAGATEVREVKTEPVNQNSVAMLCHLIALVGYVIPFGNIIGPLIVWMMNKDKSQFVDEQGKEAVNFQISMSIYALVCFILIFIGIGLILLPILGLVNLILIIIASIKASGGESYRYPMSIRLVK